MTLALENNIDHSFFVILYEANNVGWKVTLGACSGLCCRTVWRTCILLGFLAFDSSLKITNFTMVPRLSRWAFRSSLQNMRNTKRYIKSKKHLDITWGVTVHVFVLKTFGAGLLVRYTCVLNEFSVVLTTAPVELLCVRKVILNSKSPPKTGQYLLYQYTSMLKSNEGHRVSCYRISARSKCVCTEKSFLCTATLTLL